MTLNLLTNLFQYIIFPLLITMSKLKGIVISLRPHQWIKNLFIFAPLIFSKYAIHLYPILKEITAFFIFSLLSGSVYIINDICDIEYDRKHPIKKARPIASGIIKPKDALIFSFSLIIITLSLSYILSKYFFIVAFIYLLINLFYSLKLKTIPFLDVVVIATGFGLRIIAGAFVIEVNPSLWLIICGFLLSLFLAFGKRRHEISLKGADQQRKVLKAYSEKGLDLALYSTGILTTIAYISYCLSSHTRIFFNTKYMILTSPFVIFGLFRYIKIVKRGKDAQSPTEAMIHDFPFLINIAL